MFFSFHHKGPRTHGGAHHWWESQNQHDLKQLRGCNLVHCTQSGSLRTSPSTASGWLWVVSTCWPQNGWNKASLYPNNICAAKKSTVCTVCTGAEGSCVPLSINVELYGAGCPSIRIPCAQLSLKPWHTPGFSCTPDGPGLWTTSMLFLRELLTYECLCM